jgi:hypothetical protein
MNTLTQQREATSCRGMKAVNFKMLNRLVMVRGVLEMKASLDCDFPYENDC